MTTLLPDAPADVAADRALSLLASDAELAADLLERAERWADAAEVRLVAEVVGRLTR